MRKTFIFFFVLLLSLSALAQQSRHFTFHYAFSVRNVPSGRKIEIWFPQAHSDAFQSVTVSTKQGDLKLRQEQEGEYKNVLLYAEEKKASRADYKFAVDYDVIRREHVELVNGKLAPNVRPEKVPQPTLARY